MLYIREGTQTSFYWCKTWIHHNTGAEGRAKLKSLFIARNKSCPHLHSWPTLKVLSILEAVVNVWDPPWTPIGELHMGKKRAYSATYLSEDLYTLLIANCPSLPQWIWSVVSLAALYPSHYAMEPIYSSTALPRVGQDSKAVYSLVPVQIPPSSAQAASTARNELLSCAMSSHDKAPRLHI